MKRVAFVLSGGASLGAIQAGMLRALYERGVAPDLIVGTSVGALNGAFIASRPATPATAEALAEVWLGLALREVFPLNPITGFIGFFGRRNHLVPVGHLRRLVRGQLGFERLEDADVPLHVIATDVATGREVRLSRGDALDAVMASAAIPGVFPPVQWGDRELIDGGVANNAPISHALELGATDVYVLPTGYACDLEEPPRGGAGDAAALHEPARAASPDDGDRAPEGPGAVVVLPPPCPLSVQPIDFSRARELVERAYEDAGLFLDSADGKGSAAPLTMRFDRLRARAA
jgi:NTE family protein